MSVNHVEVQSFLDDLLLDFVWEIIPDGIWSIDAVEEEDTSRPGVLEYIETLQEGELVACDKAGLTGANQIGRVDGIRPEAQVRDGDRPRFLGVVDEVALCIVAGLLADNLDRILVGSHRAIRAQPPEHALHGISTFDGKSRVVLQAAMGHVVMNANCKVLFRFGHGHLVEDTLDHRRREFFR